MLIKFSFDRSFENLQETQFNKSNSISITVAILKNVIVDMEKQMENTKNKTTR